MILLHFNNLQTTSTFSRARSRPKARTAIDFTSPMGTLWTWLVSRVFAAPPSTPESVTARVIDGSKLLVEWVPGALQTPHNETDEYVVSVRCVEGVVATALGDECETWMEVYQGGGRSFTLEKVAEGTTLEVRVRCENAKGQSRWVRAADVVRVSGLREGRGRNDDKEQWGSQWKPKSNSGA